MDLKNRRNRRTHRRPRAALSVVGVANEERAVVHGARDEVELQRLLDELGVEIVVAAVKPPRIGLN
jgi:hypothetical protein